ncbi:MAG: M42 family metallopeptidase [Candidatus Aegiribacteria sp.]|nr:M42 family metallopeptidase [Candidatus Aegiribacteria sp.]
MNTESAVTDILMELLTIRSVSGHTEEAMEIIEERFRELGLKTAVTRKGSLLATLEGRSKEGIILSAHMDTLGGMVSGIEEENGIIRLRSVGSFTMSSIEGEYCRIETWEGKLFDGTVLFDSTSVHVHGIEDASAKRKKKNMYVRLDEEVSSGKEVRKLGISVGNYIHFDPRPVLTESGFIKSRHLDDKAGVAVLIQAAADLVSNTIIPSHKLHFLVTGYEEVGHGAAGFLPENLREFIAVDMGVAGPGRESSEDKVTICAADSTGPFNYLLTKELIEVAKAESIPYAVDTFPHYGSDATVALKAGLDVRHGLIGPGVDSSHAMERTHVKALRATIDLIKAYVSR